MPTINGSRGAFRQPQKFGRNSSGQYTEWVYQGTRQEVSGLIPIMEASGAEWDLEESFSGAADKLTVRFSSIPGGGIEDTAVNDWEFFAGEIEKDILDSNIAAINNLSPGDKSVIREFINSPSQSNDPDILGTLQTPVTNSTTARQVYELMVAGLRSARALQPTLRHTQTVGNAWTVPASFVNVGAIIATSAMATLESIPNDILFSLPNYSSNRSGLVFGWYKKHPTVRKSARQRTQIEQQWEYGLWPTLIYGALVT